MSVSLLSQGTTVTWSGSALTNVTRVSVGGGDIGQDAQEVSVAHLGSCHCKEEPFLKTWANPAADGAAASQIQVDFMGASPFTKDQVAGFSVTGPASFSFASCTCVSVQVSAQVGDVVRGSAVLRFS